MLQRVHSGDGCELVSTLCMYDLRKCDLFVLSWVRVMRVSISLELLMCGGGAHIIIIINYIILLLCLVARYLERIERYIYMRLQWAPHFQNPNFQLVSLFLPRLGPT